MGSTMRLIVLICALASALALPVKNIKPKPLKSAAAKYIVSDDIFSKLITSNQDTKRWLVHVDIAVATRRSALTCNNCLWPKSSNGIVYVPYTLSSAYGQDHVSMITSAMEDFAAMTCVQFIPRTNEVNFLDIQPQEGCWSFIGRVGKAQVLSLGLAPNKCMFNEVIQHELNHALGFVHEHCRSDRDEHIQIRKQFISPEKLSNFDKLNTNNLGLPYDYTSVMHYGRYLFSNTSGEATIVPIPDPNVAVGQSYGLNSLDVAKINRLYNCSLCSNILINWSGNFSSANYPSAYSNGLNCTWLIRTPELNQKNKLYMKFDALDIQTSSSCTADYIRIYDGPSRSSPLLMDRSCGSTLPLPVFSSSTKLLLEFITDSSQTSTGFQASFTTVQCGQSYTTLGQNITSPGYPADYLPQMYCLWVITAPVNRKVKLTIKAFNLESSNNCTNDYLAIYDGTLTKKALGPLLCGSTIPRPVTSSGRSMLLKFHSDASDQASGFLASYTFEP